MSPSNDNLNPGDLLERRVAELKRLVAARIASTRAEIDRLTGRPKMQHAGQSPFRLGAWYRAAPPSAAGPGGIAANGEVGITT